MWQIEMNLEAEFTKYLWNNFIQACALSHIAAGTLNTEYLGIFC